MFHSFSKRSGHKSSLSLKPKTIQSSRTCLDWVLYSTCHPISFVKPSGREGPAGITRKQEVLRRKRKFLSREHFNRPAPIILQYLPIMFLRTSSKITYYSRNLLFSNYSHKLLYEYCVEPCVLHDYATYYWRVLIWQYS